MIADPVFHQLTFCDWQLYVPVPAFYVVKRMCHPSSGVLVVTSDLLQYLNDLNHIVIQSDLLSHLDCPPLLILDSFSALHPRHFASWDRI